MTEPRLPGPATSPRSPGRGRLVDRSTQAWVRAAGREVTWAEHPWLEAPVGDVEVIGTDFFHRWAERRGGWIEEGGEACGLLEDFGQVEGAGCRPAEVDPGVAHFYERTSEYDFDIWSRWRGSFRPFGALLSRLFSRRLQQLNVPLSPLDSRLGIRSRVFRLRDPDGRSLGAAWVRETIATGDALYVGSYSLCRVPGFAGSCVKVAFPLPNGYALVVMRPESHADGSFTLHSKGRRFGDPGFYFYVEAEPGRGWSRYLSSFRERIHVYRDEHGALRADHDLRLWGAPCLALHYRMRGAGGA